jgi:hypothetical protein
MINDISIPLKQHNRAQIKGITVPSPLHHCLITVLSLFLAVGFVSPPDQLPHFQGIAKGQNMINDISKPSK